AMAKVFRGYGQIKAGRFDTGIADLGEAIAWLEQSGLSHVRLAPTLRLAEGYLGRGEATAARAAVDDVLSRSRATGYRYLEGLADRLMGECLAEESPTIAMHHVADALRLFKAIDARNDLAKTLVTQAKLTQGYGHLAEA